jgi:hypothetical protein
VSERTATLRNTPSSPAAPQTTNQFGGIEIHVRDAADVADLMFDLRRQGIGLKNRRG